MKFVIADTLTESLARLDGPLHALAAKSVFEFTRDPSQPGFQFHRLSGTKDPNFWSFRVSQDVRVIVHKAGESAVLCYVDHHDAAYKWAERRKLEVHPQTGAAQFISTSERVEEIVKRVVREVEDEPPVFRGYEKDYLLDLGVPEQWLDAVRAVARSKLTDLIDVLPEEAAERLLDLADGRPVPRPIKVETRDPFAHPDAQRRFRIVDSAEELRLALAAPWEKWLVFLHPSQRAAVEKDFAGPAKVSGGAGTGKTVVALHRAANLLKRNPNHRVLLTSFSSTLAARLEQHMDHLLPRGSAERERLVITNLHKLARDLWVRANRRGLKILEPDQLKRHIEQALRTTKSQAPSLEFLKSEWDCVVQPNGVATWDAYREVPRTGRGVPIGAKQRRAIWDVLEQVARSVSAAGLVTWDRVCHEVAAEIARNPRDRFDHVVADEVQDFGVAELTLLRALVLNGRSDLFLCGDAGQRIFKGKSPWAAAKIDVRGRSTILRLNYRTTEQIQRIADKFLSGHVEDNDGEINQRDTLSLLKGPEPEVVGHAGRNDEASALSKWVLKLVQEGFQPRDIAVFARSEAMLNEIVLPALESAGVPAASLRDEDALAAGAAAVGTMHRAKGLEFKAVAVVGCSKDALPSPMVFKGLTDPADIEAARDQEKSLLYVACTRARERLLISYSGAPTGFLSALAKRAAA